ncbi:copper resistance protein CopD [Pseudonocardiaceae bacterium YIM PH 21723]|nr:copper resistance protein CopD [Pseudonocardiaceae bacterium YIM PH 21723]
MATDTVDEKPVPPTTRTVSAALLVGPGLGLAVLIVIGLTALNSTADLVVDPGVVTRYGLSVVRVFTEVCAAVCVGSLFFATFLVPPQPSGVLSADGYAGLRRAGWAAAGWYLGAILTVPLTAADAVGKPVGDLLSAQVMIVLVEQISQAKAWALTAGIAFLIAVLCWVALRWGTTAVALGLSLFALLPVAVTGHSASGGAHDVATNSLIYHLIGTVIWVGGLIALIAHGLRKGNHLDLATSRFSRVALVCWVVMAASGIVNALVRLPLSDLVSTNYGLLVVAKVVALLILGVIGYYQREKAVTGVTAGKPGALLRLGTVEILIMVITIGIAVGLARTPPPTENRTVPSQIELLIGYALDGPPTLGHILFDWRFDLIFGTAAFVLAGLYLWGVSRLRQRGDEWPWGPTACWLAGCFVLLFATSSGVGRYAPAMFSVHMISHMLLSMVIPVLLVLGGPVTLALRALPVAGKDAPPGPREWLLAFVHSRFSKILTQPLIALFLFVGSFYGLYFSGLFDAALDTHWAHLAMNAHFLLVGYLFYWPVVGIDPAPRKLPPLARLGVAFASIPFHAFFGIALMSSGSVIGVNFYSQLGLPWVPDLLADQRLGGGLAWAAGELPLLIVVIALLVQWSRSDAREARRKDRQATRDGDSDLNAYNAMLTEMANGGPKKD